MSTNEKGYKIKRTIMLIIQDIFIAVGFISTIIQMKNCLTSTSEVSVQNRIITIICLVAYIAVINYAVWGYKKQYIPYKIAISLYFALTVAVFVKLTDITSAGKESVFIYAICFFVTVVIGLIIAFENTFRNYVNTAKTIGAVMVALEFIIAVSSIWLLSANGSNSLNEIMLYQPLSRFFISTVLYIAFLTRTQWRKHDKEVNKKLTEETNN